LTGEEEPWGKPEWRSYGFIRIVVRHFGLPPARVGEYRYTVTGTRLVRSVVTIYRYFAERFGEIRK
jgi:hypothetical protein